MGSSAPKRRKKAKANPKKRQVYMPYPESGKAFYVQGRTYTNKVTNLSDKLGPFNHVRICEGFIFASDRGSEKETIVSCFEHGRWLIDQASYYEVVITTIGRASNDDTTSSG